MALIIHRPGSISSSHVQHVNSALSWKCSKSCSSSHSQIRNDVTSAAICGVEAGVPSFYSIMPSYRGRAIMMAPLAAYGLNYAAPSAMPSGCGYMSYAHRNEKT